MGKLVKRLSKKEIDELMEDGIKIKEKNFSFIIKKKESLKVSFIPVGTKKAVERNKLKRKVREIFFKYQNNFNNIWLAIIIPPFVLKKDFNLLYPDFERLIWRLKNEKNLFDIN